MYGIFRLLFPLPTLRRVVCNVSLHVSHATNSDILQTLPAKETLTTAAEPQLGHARYGIIRNRLAGFLSETYMAITHIWLRWEWIFLYLKSRFSVRLFPVLTDISTPSTTDDLLTVDLPSVTLL